MIVLSPTAIDLLLTCCELGRWHVVAGNLCDVADLMRLGLVKTEDDYDLISIFITQKGTEYAAQRQWIAPDLESGYEPWARTELGKKDSNYISQRP